VGFLSFFFFYRELSGYTKVRQLGMSLGVEQDVASLDVSVDLPHEVEILQTLQGGLQDGGDLLLRQLSGDNQQGGQQQRIGLRLVNSQYT